MFSIILWKLIFLYVNYISSFVILFLWIIELITWYICKITFSSINFSYYLIIFYYLIIIFYFYFFSLLVFSFILNKISINNKKCYLRYCQFFSWKENFYRIHTIQCRPSPYISDLFLSSRRIWNPHGDIVFLYTPWKMLFL